MKKIIITGANGFIGSALVKKMIANNIEVIAVDVSFAEDHLPISDLITKIESKSDASLEEKLPIAIYDAFYHLAWRGVNGEEKTNAAIQVSNIQMAVDCVNICKRLNIKKFLCAGSVAENVIFSLSNIKSIGGGIMYGVAKYACRLILESYCKSMNLPFIWMQFSNIYGVGNTTGNLVNYTLTELLLGKEATFGPALQPYDFIYIDDLIEAVCQLGFCSAKKNFYCISSGNPRILKEYLYRIGELSGFPDKINIGIRPDDGIKYRLEMFSNKDLIEDIGEYVSTEFDKGILKTISWLRNQISK